MNFKNDSDSDVSKFGVIAVSALSYCRKEEEVPHFSESRDEQ